jgi:hypothetical protein
MPLLTLSRDFVAIGMNLGKELLVIWSRHGNRHDFYSYGFCGFDDSTQITNLLLPVDVEAALVFVPSAPVLRQDKTFFESFFLPKQDVE